MGETVRPLVPPAGSSPESSTAGAPAQGPEYAGAACSHVREQRHYSERAPPSLTCTLAR